MSFSTLQAEVQQLIDDNKALTTSAVDAPASARDAVVTVKAKKTATVPYRKTTEAIEVAVSQLKSDTLVIRDEAGTQRNNTNTSKTTTQNQIALAETEKTRAANSARDQEVAALGANSGLMSVMEVNVKPSLVLDFANGVYEKQGAYPWITETIANPLPGASLVEDATTGEVLGADLQDTETLVGLVPVDGGTLVVHSDAGVGPVASAAGNTLEATGAGRARRALVYTSGSSPDLVLEPGIVASVTLYPHALSATELEELTTPEDNT